MTRPVTTTARQALEEIQAAGLRYAGDGLPAMVPATLVFPTECVECGRPRRTNLNRIRSGGKCAHLFVTADVAEQWAAKAGWKPREPYPGRRSIPWGLACVICSWPVVLTLTQVLARKKSCRCPELVEEMRAAGYEPQTPYPGSDRKPWPSICTTCKSRRTPCLMTVRSGRRCAHQHTPHHKSRMRQRIPVAPADTDYTLPAGRRIGAQLLIRNPAGHVLLVKPSYKPGWILVGGGARPDEPPHLAARREGAEETGLTDLVPGDLLLVDYVPSQPGSAEGLNFVFDGGILRDNASITLPGPHLDRGPELLDWQFVPPGRLGDLCRPHQQARIIQALGALHDPALRGYAVLGQRVPPS